MRLRRSRFFCSVALALALPSAVSGAGIEARIKSFNLPALEGGRFDLSDHLGREVLLISFFATWCEPCAREQPHLQRLYADLRSRGFLVVGVSIDEPGNQAKLRAHVRRYGLTFPVLLDSNLELARLYAPEQSLPLTLLVDTQGVIRHSFMGYTAGDEKKIEAAVRHILDGGGAR